MQLYSFLCYKAEQIKFLFSHENELDEKSSRKKMAFLRNDFDQRESFFATYFESIKCKLDSHFMNRSEELWTGETLSQTFCLFHHQKSGAEPIVMDPYPL